MKISTLIQSALDAATLLSSDLNKGGDVDVTTFDKWTEALLRFGFYHTKQRTHSQCIENLHRELLLIVKNNPSRAIEILEEYIAIVTEVRDAATDLNHSIEWEPPFDRGIVYDYT
jgi:hypothetical protein